MQLFVDFFFIHLLKRKLSREEINWIQLCWLQVIILIILFWRFPIRSSVIVCNFFVRWFLIFYWIAVATDYQWYAIIQQIIFKSCITKLYTGLLKFIESFQGINKINEKNNSDLLRFYSHLFSTLIFTTIRIDIFHKLTGIFFLGKHQVKVSFFVYYSRHKFYTECGLIGH